MTCVLVETEEFIEEKTICMRPALHIKPNNDNVDIIPLHWDLVGLPLQSLQLCGFLFDLPLKDLISNLLLAFDS